MLAIATRVDPPYDPGKCHCRGWSHLRPNTAKLSKLPLAHQPGAVWEYSVAVDVLGRIVEIVSGRELDVFIGERITKPLGMTATATIAVLSSAGRLVPGRVAARG